jgi:hypothetical protein
MPFSAFSSDDRAGAQERRRAHRKRVSLRATMTLGQGLVHAVATDLSSSGMRLLTPRPVEVGVGVEVAFLLDGNMIAGRGVVRWCAPGERDLIAFGMDFTFLEEDGAAIVAAFVAAP